MILNTNNLKYLALCFIALPLFYVCNTSNNTVNSITIFCGSASKPAIQELTSIFKNETNINVNLIFGGSGTLLSQIEFSKKGDVYIPGSPDYLLKGINKNILIKMKSDILAYLIPALIVPPSNPGNIKNLMDLSKTGIKVGIGNPSSVCLGIYAIELFDFYKTRASILNNVITYGGSCSRTVNLVTMNQVDVIFGWRVFSFWNPNKLKYIPIDPMKIPRISYIPVSIIKYSKSLKNAEKYVDFILSKRGKSIFNKYGYITDLETAKKFAPKSKIGGEYMITGNIEIK